MWLCVFDWLFVSYSMGKQKLQDIYLKLDRSVYEEGSSSKTKISKLPTIPEEGIFVRKAQYEKPLSPKKNEYDY